MNCSNCGSELIDGRCTVCGRSLPPNARGAIDAVTGLMLAGWWRRVGATVSDGLILALPSLLVAASFNEKTSSGLAAICVVIINGLYTIPLLRGERGQTVGNRVAASRVRNAADGARLTTEQVVRRWAFITFFATIGVLSVSLLYVGSLVLLADYLTPLFDARKQTLHDKFARTIVVIA